MEFTDTTRWLTKAQRISDARQAIEAAIAGYGDECFDWQHIEQVQGRANAALHYLIRQAGRYTNADTDPCSVS